MATMTITRRLVLLATALAASAAAAQTTTTYRWIDQATGKTVYSDQPPPAGARQVVKSNAAGAADEPAVPYATRRAAERFPVTLYTTANCLEPCQRGRALLNGRGVPFTEKLLGSEEELAELGRKIGGEPAVPSIFVGREHFVGFEDSAWSNLLDLASYPKSAPYGAKAQGAFSQ